MQILFVAAGVSPLHADSDAAREATGLATSLKALGHKVTVLAPLDESVDAQRHGLARRLSKAKYDAAGEAGAAEVYTARTVSGLDVVMLGGAALFSDRAGVGDLPNDETAVRGAHFALAAASYICDADEVYDAVHGVGWLGAATVSALGQRGDDAPPSGIHLAAGAQEIPAPMALASDLGGGELVAAALDAGAFATLGASLDANAPAAWRAAVDALGGAVLTLRPGLDTTVWNAATDPQIPARFDPFDRGGKARCKARLQRDMTLPVRPDVPLIGIVGHTSDEGLANVAKVATEFLRNDAQLVVHVRGEGALVEALEEVWDRWPDRLEIRTRGDERTMHRLVAGCDALYVAADDQSLGCLAAAAQRYGALPIVAESHPFGSALVDLDADLASGHAFLLDGNGEGDVLGGLRRVAAGFVDEEAFRAAQSRAMRVEHGQSAAAESLASLYERSIDPDDDAEAVA